MTKKTYIIEYTAYNKEGGVLKCGKMMAKNKFNSLEAQCSFETFLEKKYPDFGNLIVHKCTEENPFNSMFGNIDDTFGDIFKDFKF